MNVISSSRVRFACAVALFATLVFVAPRVAAGETSIPPAPTILSPRPSAVVTSTFEVVGRIGTGVVELRATGAKEASFTLGDPQDGETTFTARITIAYGKHTVRIDAFDGDGWSESSSLTVWNLGSLPRGRRFVLVDKSDFMLYVVRGDAVVRTFPVAIGMRGTPTPTGTRYLGRPIPPGAGGSVWGPFRMRLYRRIHVRVAYWARVDGHRVRRHKTVHRYVGTSYYIHGTNDPDSIGTPASHGCIRMYNSHLRKFKDLTYRYQLTIIRR